MVSCNIVLVCYQHHFLAGESSCYEPPVQVLRGTLRTLRTLEEVEMSPAGTRIL